jgi:four helix bundle protein
MADSTRNFKDLECWKAAREVRVFVRDLITTFPRFETFDLTENIRLAARSITRNISEGYGRFNFQENIQFCKVARGSLYEIWDDLITSYDEGYIQKDQLEKVSVLIEEAIRTLNGYIVYMERNKVKLPAN